MKRECVRERNTEGGKKERNIMANEGLWKEIVNLHDTKYKWSETKKGYADRDKGSDGKNMENSE